MSGTGFSFGSGGLGSSFSFGANQPATTTASGGLFASPTTNTVSFGSAAAPLFGGTTATSQPSGGLTFNAGQAPGLSFGVPATTAVTGLTFGTTQPATFAFPAPATSAGPTFGTAASTASTGLTFALPAASTPSTGLSFGAPVATTTSGFGFGLQATTAATPGISFGTPAQATTAASTVPPGGLTLGAPSTGGLFGSLATTTASGFSLGGFGTTTQSTALTAPSSLTFGSAAPATSVATLSFQGLGTTKPLGGSLFQTPATSTTATSAFSLATSSGFGLFGQPSIKPTASVAAVGTTPTVTTASLGLGGVEAKAGLAGLGTQRQESKAVKENEIPVEVIQTIESFKNFVKAQKSLSSEIARGSAQPLDKVEEDVEAMKKVLSNLSADLKRHTALANNLKYDTAKCLQNAEMGQRTHDMPPELQYNNTAPQQYFEELVEKFETEVNTLAVAIEDAEKHLHSLTQPRVLTPDELTSAMQRIHDTFVFLAGRLQMVHNSVEIQKQQYLNLRKYFLKDATNVFEKQLDKSGLDQKPKSSANDTLPGPSPFSGIGSQMGFGLLLPSASDTPSALPSTNPLGWGGALVPNQQPTQQPMAQATSFGGAASPFSSLKTPQPVENQSFQLQRPPVGNKRGKR